jgi:hypothetical protein
MCIVLDRLCVQMVLMRHFMFKMANKNYTHAHGEVVDALLKLVPHLSNTIYFYYPQISQMSD